MLEQKKHSFLSVVIPCYNEEDVLDELRKRLIPACEAIVGDAFEVLLVDDGSSDKTREILRRFSEEDPRFVSVLLARNHGHQLALTAGLEVASGDRIFVLDADLQDPPELLGPMMQKMDEGYDVVYGKRRARKGETAFKRGTAAAFYRVLRRLTEVDVPADTGDFRLMSRRVNEVLRDMPEQHRFVRGMVAWVGFRQTGVEYDRDERFAGVTKYPFRKMLRFAVDAITSFSVIPLKIATWLGFALAAFSLLVLIYTLIGWFTGETVPGWTSLMVIVLLIGSFQMIAIGVLGEYIGRLYVQGKKRPLFIIEDVLNAKSGNASQAAAIKAPSEVA